MSQDAKQKKQRIVTTEYNVETSKPTEKKQNVLVNANVALSEFNWEVHQADCPTNFRTPNSNINAPEDVKIFSRESYAQDLYDLMEKHAEGKEYLFKLESGETHEGVVSSVNTEWATIDIGFKEMVYINMSRESDISKESIIPGKGISVQILADTNKKASGFVLGSVEAGLRSQVLQEILASIEDANTAYVGKVVSMIPGGGYMVNIQGIDCFMPGSLAGINKLVDFESIIGSDMYVVPTNYSVERGTVIVSHRAYLQALIPHKIEELKANMEGLRIGNVTGSAKYGVFVEFEGCLTGMIHINDLSPELHKRHISRDIKPGDEIEFKIKEIISDTKITLTQLEVIDVVDPWKLIIEKYTKFPVEVSGTIKSVKEYGVFVDVFEGIVGLLHVSELPENIVIDDLNKEDKITVQIQRIEADTRKVFLKL